MNVKQNNPIDIGLILNKLYTIRNIANVAFQCPDKYAEAYVFQDILNHISEMAQSLIEEVDR